MRARAFVAFSIAPLLLASPVFAGPASAPAFFPATARYKKMLKETRAKPLVNVEELFAFAVTAGEEIRADITKVDEAKAAGRDAKPAITALEGLVISTDEALIATPDSKFFGALAEKKGRPADKAFFKMLVATKPDGVWAAYFEQQTDVTGCMRFDLPELPSIYSGWLDFKARFPEAYTEQVLQELHGLDDALLSDCACGAKATVVAGLEAIAKALPKAPVAARLRERLNEIRDGKTKIRFQCASG